MPPKKAKPEAKAKKLPESKPKPKKKIKRIKIRKRKEKPDTVMVDFYKTLDITNGAQVSLEIMQDLEKILFDTITEKELAPFIKPYVLGQVLLASQNLTLLELEK